MASTTLKQTVLFTPTAIPGCVMWLDGADPNGTGVKPANGTTISTWVDKSSSGYNATVSSGRIGGTFSSALQTMYFQSSNVGYQTSYTANPTNETMFFVANIDSPTNINNNTIIGGQLGARSFGFGYSGYGGIGTSGYLNNEVAWAGTYTGSTPAGVTTMITGTVTSTTNVGVGLNGSNLITGSITAWYGGTTTYLGVDTTTTSYYYKGYIMDILFYNSVLPTEQRQQVEGYLAWKWGLQGSLPIGHAYKNYSPFVNTTVSLPVSLTMPLRQINTAGFLPTQITGCQLWLDAADPTAIVNGPGSQVSQLNDKSGNSYNATQDTSASQPVRAGNYITFSSNRYFNFSQSAINNTSTYSIFLVFNPAASVNWIIQKQANGVGSYNMLSMTNYWNANVGSTNYLYWNSWANSYSPLNSGTALQLNTVQLVEITYNGTTLSMYRNGILLSSVNGTYTIQNKTDATNCTIGSWIADGTVRDSGVTNFQFGELIYHNTAITTDQRQKIEGYLAQKWGLNASLPDGHPYKSIPKKVEFPFQLIRQASTNWRPTNYSSCVQWLDASDYNSLVFSGNYITQWTDKSTNNNHVLQAGASNIPTYSSTLVNSKPGLNFMGGAGLQSSSFAKSSNVTLLLVGAVTASIGGWGTFWGHFTVGRHDSDVQLRNTSGQSVINWHTNNNNVSSQLTYIVNSPVLYSCTMSGGINMFMQQTNTGGTSSVSVTESLTWQAGSAPVWIGRSDVNESINSYICEIIYYQTVLTTEQRQQAEGYLAWKWGLQGNLPATHPYKNFPPPPQ